jgi:peptidoglycan/LPS O-acetylase OafA/YrhL
VPSPKAFDTILPSSENRSRGYLEMVSLFRIIACAAVLGNHAFIWTGMSHNAIGTGVIALLHVSRNAFFFLTGLVICYSQLVHPRTLRAFWKRRYLQLGVPYLAWTGIYLVFKTFRVGFSWHEVGSFLRMNLVTGYSQLYAAFVIFQFYIVFPLLLRLLRSTRRHGLIMAASLAFAMMLGLVLHYPTCVPPLSQACHFLGAHLPWSRDLLTYQEFFVAGALVAFHLDQVRRFVRQRCRQILLLSTGAGAIMVLWYSVQIETGSSLLQASDPYQSAGVLWYFAAIAGIFAVSEWWDQKSSRKSNSTSQAGATLAARIGALTGGVWLSHNLVLSSLRALLQGIGLRESLPWEATVAVLFFGTVALSGGFVAILLRTRLRWVLGGPLRSEQRRGMNAPRDIAVRTNATHTAATA